MGRACARRVKTEYISANRSRDIRLSNPRVNTGHDAKARVGEEK